MHRIFGSREKGNEFKNFPPPISGNSLDPKGRKYPYVIASLLVLNGVIVSIIRSNGGFGFVGLFAAFCFVYTYLSLVTGCAIKREEGEITRESQPLLFWPIVIMLGIVGIWLTLAPWLSL